MALRLILTTRPERWGKKPATDAEVFASVTGRPGQETTIQSDHWARLHASDRPRRPALKLGCPFP